jgi:hypothetical protein
MGSLSGSKQAGESEAGQIFWVFISMWIYHLFDGSITLSAIIDVIGHQNARSSM